MRTVKPSANPPTSPDFFRRYIDRKIIARIAQKCNSAREILALPLCLELTEVGLVFGGETGVLEQIGTPFPGAAQGLLATPVCDCGVVA